MLHDSPSMDPVRSDPLLKPKRRWFRFSIRAMMLMVLIAGTFLSWPINRANVQRRAVAAIKRADPRAGLLYDFHYGPNGKGIPNATPRAPAWLRRWIGDEFFQEVDSVNLPGPVTDATLATLAEFPRLRILHVRDSSKIGDGLRHLSEMRNLERLELNGRGITDAGLMNLRGLRKLFWVRLEDTGITDAGLAHVAALTELKALSLQGKQGSASGFSGRGIVHVTDAGLGSLSGLHRLRSLAIASAPGITDLAPLDLRRNLPFLESLDLHDTGITDAGLAPIEGLTSLTTLNLRSTPISDAGLAHLRGLTNLETLYLDSTKVSDDGLADVAGLSALRRLGLGSTRISDEGLVHLKRLANLRILYINRTRVTDAAKKQALSALKKRR